MKSIHLLALAVGALAASAGRPALAAESYDGCRGYITSLPAVITQQGVWCLTGDLATSITNGAAIRIDANNVTIDCNGFKVGGFGAGPGTFAFGVTSYDRANAVVRNCNIRGFAEGIYLYGAGGKHLVEDNRIEGTLHVGIFAGGPHSLVRRNQVRDTIGAPDSYTYSLGIVAEGDVLDNTVDVVDNQGTFGIELRGQGSIARGNVVRNVVGNVRTFLAVQNIDAVVQDNVIQSDLVNWQAIEGPGESLAICRGNITIGFTQAFNDCTDAGGNFNR